MRAPHRIAGFLYGPKPAPEAARAPHVPVPQHFLLDDPVLLGYLAPRSGGHSYAGPSTRMSLFTGCTIIIAQFVKAVPLFGQQVIRLV